MPLSDHPNPEISCFYEKGFSQITELNAGKALHAHCLKGFERLGLFFTNTLINMYSKFGHVGCARYLFDKMPMRNEASWNTMMSVFVRVGLYQESVMFFREMQDYVISPSGFLVSSVITACDRSGCMLYEGVQVHALVFKYGLLRDVFVGTSLLHFYGTYGLILNAEKLFAEMPERNVVSWVSLMVGYLDNGEPNAVVDAYQRMRKEGVDCNENTFTAVITACGLLENEWLNYQILGHVVKSSLEDNVSVANSLISAFGSHGNLKEASYVFNNMGKRDTISWNSIISANAHYGHWRESLILFHSMRHFHGEINSTTLSTLISTCSSMDNLTWGRGIHGLVFRLGLDTNVSVGNTLLCMYSEAGRSEDAEYVFHEMRERDLVSWNSMVACYAKDGRSLDALKFFNEMLWMRKTVNYVTFTSTLAACSTLDFLAEGKKVHALAILMGQHDILIVGNALVTLYAKSGVVLQAQKVCKTMPKRHEVTWNALIGGYAQAEEPEEAVKAFRLMREEGLLPNYITVVSVLGASSVPEDLLRHGMPIHAYVVSAGHESNKHVQNSLMTMYAKCGDLHSSNSIFDEVADKTSVSWNAIIAANAYHGLGEDVLKLIVKMRSAGIDLDQFSLSEGFAASAKLAMLEEGQQLHSLAVKLGCESDLFVTNAAMDMYGKCGEIDDVIRMLPPTVNRSLLSWNILISAFSRHGHFEKARDTFHDMLEAGLKPSHVTFVSLLSACSHGGLVDKGLAYYALMEKEFGVQPAIEHCVCIVDLLGRMGRLVEAETFINDMPVPPNDLVWRSLLAACKIYGNMELGKKTAKNLFELNSSDDSAYVLYSNVCATTGRWEDVDNVRRKMGINNIKKQQACSWLKSKNGVNTFGIGDQTHPQTTEIYVKLGELKKIIKEAGYIPDTSYALQDMDEEQKEHNLWNHSERLALAYGLISTPEGSTIRIFKNLRVCVDCHSVFKFVSCITRRKIVLRDPYRFHHFNGGECSCVDYW